MARQTLSLQRPFRESADDARAGFTALLKMLGEEHDAQVTGMTAEIARLRSKVRELKQAADGGDTPMRAQSTGPRAALSKPVEAPASHDGYVRGESKDLCCGGEQLARPKSAISFSSPKRTPSKDIGRSSTFVVESDDDDSAAPAFRTLEMIQGSLGMRPVSSNASSQHNRRTLERRLCVLDSAVGVAIVANTLLLGVSTDLRPQWNGWVAIDGCFALLFAVDLALKLRIAGCARFFWRADDFVPNICETTLVVLALLETALAIASISGNGSQSATLMLAFRVLRLFRVFRIFRVLRLEMFTELKLMIRGTVGGMRTLFWSTFLIVLPVYSLSLVMRETVGKVDEVGSGAEYFGSVPLAVFSVFRCLVIGDCADSSGRPLFVLITDAYGWGFALIYCVMSVFMSLGLFNVIVAIFVENVVAAASSKSRKARKERLRNKSFFAKKMAQLLKVVCEIYDDHSDVDRSYEKHPDNLADIFDRASWMEITPDLFDLMRYDPRVQKIFDDLDLADEDQFILFQTLDADGSGAVDLEELCSGISKLRGDACRSDIVSINFMIQGVRSELRTCMTRFLKRLYKQEDLLAELRRLNEPVSEIC